VTVRVGPSQQCRQEAGSARRDITRADIVNLIWSNGRIIDATSAKAPTRFPSRR